jgi:hypothetical protein
MFLLRAEILQKIRQHDSKLSNLLQTFQVSSILASGCLTSLETKLTLEARVAQIVQERKVRVFRTSIL